MCFQRLKKKYHRYTIQSYEYVCFYMGPQVVVGNLRNGFIPLVIAGVIIWHQPKQHNALLQGNSLKTTILLHLIPPKMGNSMIVMIPVLACCKNANS